MRRFAVLEEGNIFRQKLRRGTTRYWNFSPLMMGNHRRGSEMLAALRNPGAETTLVFYGSSGGVWGQLLILPPAPQVSSNFPSEEKLHKVRSAKQPDAKVCKTGSSGDRWFSFKLIDSHGCHTFPSNLLSSPPLPKSLKAFSSPSDHVASPLEPLFLSAPCRFYFPGGRLTKMEGVFFSSFTQGMANTPSEKNVGQNLRKEGCR